MYLVQHSLDADFTRIYKYITNVTRWKRNCMEFRIHLLSPLTFNLNWVPNSSAYLPPKCPFVATIKSKKDCTACACWFSTMWYLGWLGFFDTVVLNAKELEESPPWEGHFISEFKKRKVSGREQSNNS